MGTLPWLPDASTTSATVLGPTALSCPDRIVGLLAAQSEPCAHFFWHLSVRSRLLVFESCASCGDSALRVTTMGGVKVCSRTPEFECCSLIKVLCVLKMIFFDIFPRFAGTKKAPLLEATHVHTAEKEEDRQREEHATNTYINSPSKSKGTRLFL